MHLTTGMMIGESHLGNEGRSASVDEQEITHCGRRCGVEDEEEENTVEQHDACNGIMMITVLGNNVFEA